MAIGETSKAHDPPIHPGHEHDAIAIALRASPSALVGLELSEHSTTGEVLQAGLIDAARRLIENDAIVRADENPEGVHQARVGTRRFRAHLRTFHPIIDSDWAAPVASELKWFASTLGPVRDADVMGDRFRRQLHELDEPADTVVASALFSQLDVERHEALATLLTAMETPRYRRLLALTVDAARDPQLKAKAQRPALEYLSKLVRKPFDRVRRDVEALPPDPPDEMLHRLRVRVKRARYSVDAAAGVVGRPARLLQRSLRSLQEVLGDHQDAVVAESWLRAHVPALSPSAALVAGELVAVQRTEAERLRAEWLQAWTACTRPRAVEWLA
jgi:CHAD domain-containing protein